MVHGVPEVILRVTRRQVTSRQVSRRRASLTPGISRRGLAGAIPSARRLRAPFGLAAALRSAVGLVSDFGLRVVRGNEVRCTGKACENSRPQLAPAHAIRNSSSWLSVAE